MRQEGGVGHHHTPRLLCPGATTSQQSLLTSECNRQHVTTILVRSGAPIRIAGRHRAKKKSTCTPRPRVLPHSGEDGPSPPPPPWGRTRGGAGHGEGGGALPNMSGSGSTQPPPPLYHQASKQHQTCHTIFYPVEILSSTPSLQPSTHNALHNDSALWHHEEESFPGQECRHCQLPWSSRRLWL